VAGAFNFSCRPTSVVNVPDFVEILNFKVPPGATDGQFMVTGNFGEDVTKVDGQVTGYLYSAADVRVVGMIGATRIVVASAQLGLRRSSYSYAFVQGVDGRNWEALSIEARWILDGLTGALMTTAFGALYPTGVTPIVAELAAAGFINVGGA
jgi:hypothetical protein